MLYEIEFTVNGKIRRAEVTPSQRLLDLLREDLGLTGAKEGCGQGECGACSVLMNGQVVASCLVLALQADGAEIVTVEGLQQGNDLHLLQQAFIETGAVQCGFCTPGMIMAAKAVLDRNPSPSEHEIRRGLSGNICRCTGYARIIEAVQLASERLKKNENFPQSSI